MIASLGGYMARMKTLLLLAVCVLAATSVVYAQQVTASVFVPSNASGSFGNPLGSGGAPLVSALTVTGPATITVTYVSGTITDAGGVNTRPNGDTCNTAAAHTPLHDQQAVSRGSLTN